MPADRIPLFPLDVVLYPGMPLPLHIFESRYKLMTRRCVARHSEFGVVLARKEGFARVGCTAEILKVVREYPDGRLDILTMGQTICRILKVYEEQPYLEAEVDFLDDGSEEEVPPPSSELVRLHQECHQLVFGSPPDALNPEARWGVAFQIAAELPLDLEMKQELLETPGEAARQARLVEHLKKTLPQLARIEVRRKKAGGNGHGGG